ncbi:MAG: hypothetical protein U0223_00880 [Nitrospira sp.]
MVLRGAQSQRSGRAGCVFLTRRAFSSFHARFMQEQSDALYLPQEGQMTGGHPTGLHGGEQCWQPQKGLASPGARG